MTETKTEKYLGDMISGTGNEENMKQLLLSLAIQKKDWISVNIRPDDYPKRGCSWELLYWNWACFS